MVLRFVAAITVALFACSGGRRGYTRSALPFESPPPRSNNAVGSRNNDPKLYVVNAGNSTVSVFDLANTSSTPIVITGGGLYGPSGATINAKGDLYVTNPVVDSVSVFDTAHADAVMPEITGPRNPYYPGGAAVDENGTLYIANAGVNSVSVFDGLPSAVERTITGGGLSTPWGVAVGANGKLYIANENRNSVSVFDTEHGNVALRPISGNGLNFPFGIAIAPNGRLYVANLNSNKVSVFNTAHANAALAPITGGGLRGPSGLALDAGGKLYVANSQLATRERVRYDARECGIKAHHRRRPELSVWHCSPLRTHFHRTSSTECRSSLLATSLHFRLTASSFVMRWISMPSRWTSCSSAAAQPDSPGQSNSRVS